MVRWLALTFFVMMVTDGIMTYWAVNHGFIEQNPLMVPIAGTWVLPVWKAFMALVAVVLMLLVAWRFLKWVELGFVLCIILMSWVLVSNVVELCEGAGSVAG